MEAEIIYEKPQCKHFKDLSGKKFGKLTVISFAYKKRVGKTAYHIFYNCKCECLKNCVVSSGSMKNGHTKSCGCLNDEERKRAKSHGLTNHPIYLRCLHQIHRCHNPNNYKYDSYGARGIKVCDRWRNDIGLMIKEVESEIGLPSSSDFEIDRIDNNGNYEPGNIRWVDRETNSRNRRCSHDHARDPVTRDETQTYRSWRKMVYKHKDEVCYEWIYDKNSDTTNGFQQFLADMGEKPKGTRFRRINKLKEFSKSNCYWG